MKITYYVTIFITKTGQIYLNVFLIKKGWKSIEWMSVFELLVLILTDSKCKLHQIISNLKKKWKKYELINQ